MLLLVVVVVVVEVVVIIRRILNHSYYQFVFVISDENASKSNYGCWMLLGLGLVL